MKQKKLIFNQQDNRETYRKLLKGKWEKKSLQQLQLILLVGYIDFDEDEDDKVFNG